MKILSVRREFDADHSSSTYEFFALERLTAKQRQAVNALTGKSARRHLQFHYQGDWNDLPYTWINQLLALGYEILVSESYDWWSVYLALPHDPELQMRLTAYQCDAENGFQVEVVENQLILYFGIQLDYNAVYHALGEDPFKGLAELFKSIREELLAGDISAARAHHHTYCKYDEVEEEAECEPLKTSLSDSAEILLNILDTDW